MSAAGLDPVFAYAFRRTGLLVSEDNLRLLRPEDRKAWENACREYQEMTGQGVAGGPHRRRLRAQPR